MSIAADLIDKRVVRRYLDRGVIDHSGFQQYIDQLPDCAGRCVQPSAERATERTTQEATRDASDDVAQAHAGAQ